MQYSLLNSIIGAWHTSETALVVLTLSSEGVPSRKKMEPWYVPAKTFIFGIVEPLLQTVYMNTDYEFKIIRAKAIYGNNPNVKNMKQVLDLKRQAQKCKQLRVMHCSNLVSTDGIEECKMLANLNLASNRLQNIDAIGLLTKLQILDVKANRIRSLKPIEKLSKLQKIDASHNIIQSLQGFGNGNNQLQSIILFHNNLREPEEILTFKTFNKIMEISFERNSKSNPFCQNRKEYQKYLKQGLVSSRFSLQKVDDISGKDIEKIFAEKQSVIEERSQEYTRSMGQERDQSAFFQNRRVLTATNGLHQTNSVNPNLASQKIMHLTQRQYDLERLVDIKDDAIEELRSKAAQLELTNANFYKDSLKKEIEYERVYGQVTEMAKNIDHKDVKINELHKRIEELLKINQMSTTSGQEKAGAIEKIRNQCNQLRIQNAELKVLNRDQDSRLKQLQNKALTNIEDKSQRIEELRRKNQEIMRQNYQTQKMQDEYKDRIRQLTQLLKEWEFKYQQKIKEMELFHNSQRGQLIQDYDQKEEEYMKSHEQTVKRLYQEFQDKIKSLEQEYTEALEASLQKFAILKKSYDEKANSENDMKMVLKTIVSKKNQQDQIINQCQEVILSNRKKINDLSNENQAILRQLSDMRARYQIDIKQAQDQVSKITFERNKMEVENRDLKQSNQYLQTHFDNLNTKEKDIQELEDRLQNLQTALDTKTVMLDDKNDTIENLKLQIQSLQKEQQKEQQNKVDMAEYEKLNNKYRKNKDKLLQLEKQMLEMISQNKQLNEKAELLATLDQQFSDVKQIMDKQQGQLAEKRASVVQLCEVIQKLKVIVQNYQQQISMLKQQISKMINRSQQLDRKHQRTLQQKQNQFQQKQSSMKQELQKLKEVVKHLNQISSLTKGINF